MIQIDHLREQMKEAELQIAERLGISIDEQFNMKLETGLEYLHLYFEKVPLMEKVLKQQRQFWNWWQLKWHIRNLEFLQDDEMLLYGKAFQKICYDAQHNAKQLTTQIAPPRIVYLQILPTLKKSA